MEKFSKKHLKYFARLPFSYFSAFLYLDFIAYVFYRNNKPILVWQDLYYPNDFPSIFIPKDKINWTNCSIALATKKDVREIEKENIEIKFQVPVTTEFFYSTDSFINPRGDFLRRIKQFKTNYAYSIKNSYPGDNVIKFYKFWKKQKERDGGVFIKESENYFYYCLKYLKKYSIKQIYVEVDDKLVGFAWGVTHPSGNWVGLHLKVDYQYKGLSRFLHYERAKLFKDKKLFTLGTDTHDSGIAQYKNELGPVAEKDYFYILTGKKL